ncbi:MAG: amino acid permease, partial [Candidatus Sumerlaeota bacterium]
AMVMEPYLLLKDNALFDMGFMVAAGMFAATLSSAIGSFMGAPRVLQAAARDRIIKVLRPFGRGAPDTDEPRRAIVLTGLLTFIVLQLSLMAGDKAFNIVAAVLTMFFLYTYAMLNIAAFVEVIGANPSFRPRFRFFHWSTALLGGIGCVVVAFIINPVAAMVAMIVLAALVWNIRRRELDAAFGDARRGFVYANVRKNLIRLSRMEETPKNWRPTSVVFSGNPDSREALISYAVWLEAGRGIVYLADVLQGDLEKYLPYRNTALRRLEKFCAHRNINAFPVVTIDESLTKGVKSLMQCLAVGPIRPNLIVLGWTGKPERVAGFADLLRVGKRLGMSQLIIQTSQRAFYYGPKRIDIWWRGMKNGGLMLLLAHMMTLNWEWGRTRVRVLRLLDEGSAQESALRDLESLIHEARVEAEAKVVISDVPFPEVFEAESGHADCVFLGFDVPDKGMEAGWHQQYEQLMSPDRTTILVTSEGLEDLMA